MSPIRSKEILMVCYYFPPIHSVGVLRSYHVAQQFKQHFKQVHISTTTNQERFISAPLPLEGFNISLSKTFDYRTIASYFQFKKRAFHYSAEGRSPIYSKTLTSLNNSFPINLISGEGGLVYILSSYRKMARLIEQRDISHIYSSFRPYTDHVVAYLLKRKYPHLYWIADYRDVHVDNDRNNVFFPKIQRWFNKKIMSRADKITTVSEGLASNLSQYGQTVSVLRNGISQLVNTTPSTPENQPKKFTITYTGSIFKDFQSPKTLLLVLKKLMDSNKIPAEDLQIIYAGKDSISFRNIVEEAGLSSIFVDKGMISLKESHAAQNKSHINLLLSWSRPHLKGILTGKFYEYLAANRPILLLLKGVKDPEWEYHMDRLHAGLFVYEEDQEKLNKVSAFIFDLYNEWKQNGSVKGKIPLHTLKEYEWKYIIEQLLSETKVLDYSS